MRVSPQPLTIFDNKSEKQVLLIVTSSMNSMNNCVTTRKFSLTVSWLDLGACNSWSKEQYFITHICQAACTIRPQISSVSRVKDDLQEWWRPPGKTDVEEEGARTGAVDTWGPSEQLQDRSAVCQSDTNLREHNSAAQGNDRYKPYPEVSKELRVFPSIPFTLVSGRIHDIGDAFLIFIQYPPIIPNDYLAPRCYGFWAVLERKNKSESLFSWSWEDSCWREIPTC